MQLPLYRRPNALIFLDDDPSYLEVLAVVMPRTWSLRLFTHVDDCIQYICKEHALWEADLWAHHTIIDNWRTGSPIIPKILQYWQNNPQRYALSSVYVVDYAMPAMTGLEMLGALPSWPENRVLLTGKADEIMAVTAFNQGVISRFVPKQRPDIGAYLTDILTAQLEAPMPLYDGVWRAALRQEQYAKLQDKVVSIWLHQFLKDNKWVEYMVVAQPFGILGLDSQARPHWLQLELTVDLPAAAELAESSGLAAIKVEAVRRGTHLCNAELLMALESTLASTTSTAFAVGEGCGLLGALFTEINTAPIGQSYDEFLASLPPRSTEDLA